MEHKILNHLIRSGKITIEDVNNARVEIHTQIEEELITELHDCYCYLSHENGDMKCDYYIPDGFARERWLSLLPLIRSLARDTVEAISLTNEIEGEIIP